MHRSHLASLLTVSFSLILAACGADAPVIPVPVDGGGLDGDATASEGGTGADAGDASTAECGNLEVEEGEECDDGNSSDDDECLSDCRLACGDGVVNAVELCDTAIPAGEEGACPLACDDSDACTTDTLIGSDCRVSCEYGEISAFIDGDACCPDGATSLEDEDCAVVCGNGVLESGESCDTGIAAGGAGACPTVADCADMDSCTVDGVEGAGTCDATCVRMPITMPRDGDGCCPMGATVATDGDCVGFCGDGVLSGAETCDTAIPAGAMDACPTDCDDMDACTADTLRRPGTCFAICANDAITVPRDGDMCCPSGATALTDDDCMPICGNGAVEPGEECDDGGTTPGDGCDAMCRREGGPPPTAFRLTDLDLKDPHLFTRVLFCLDVTNTAFGMDGVNPLIEDAITMDADGDGDLDLSFTTVMRPLDQTRMMTGMDVTFPDCTAPMSTTRCRADAMTTTVMSNANNQSSGTCLGALPGTTGGYSPSIVTPGAGTSSCFVSDEEMLVLNLGGITVRLQQTRIAATYSGAPARSLVNGLIRGFITEAEAEATMIPSTIAVVGGMSLASLLPGGRGNCSRRDDRDRLSDGTRGWWFYMNFSARAVPYTEP